MLALPLMEIQIRELPPYTIRVSERARRISLRFTVESGLELIIPSERHRRKAIAFLQSQQKWIAKRQAQYLAEMPAQAQDNTLPQKLLLPAIDHHWHLSYNESAYAALTILDEANTVLIRSPQGNLAKTRELLINFIKDLAETHLKPRLDELSELTELAYRSVCFGSHKTQWGSCSKTARISLNVQLLFLDKALLDYVLIHELCHTQHFNHSKCFWRLVERFVPNYRELRASLRSGKRQIPRWLLQTYLEN